MRDPRSQSTRAEVLRMDSMQHEPSDDNILLRPPFERMSSAASPTAPLNGSLPTKKIFRLPHHKYTPPSSGPRMPHKLHHAGVFCLCPASSVTCQERDHVQLALERLLAGVQLGREGRNCTGGAPRLPRPPAFGGHPRAGAPGLAASEANLRPKVQWIHETEGENVGAFIASQRTWVRLPLPRGGDRNDLYDVKTTNNRGPRALCAALG